MNVLRVSIRAILAVLVILSVAGLVQHAWYWTQLPERPTTRIGTDGRPHTPLDRTTGTLLMLAVQTGLPWMLVGVARSKSVLSSINIPNREYWLAADRRDGALSFMRKLIATFAIALSLYIMAVSHLTFLETVRGEALYTQAITYLHSLYFIGLVLAVLATIERFRIPKSGASN